MELQRATSAVDEAARQASLLICECASARRSGNDVTDQGVEAALELLQQRWREFRTLLTKDAPTGSTRVIWHITCGLWNTAIEITAKGLCSNNTTAQQVAQLRHLVCSFLLELPQASLQEGQQLMLIKFSLKASESWGALKRWEQSELILAPAARLANTICGAALAEGKQHNSRLSVSQAEEYCALLYDVHVARYITACSNNQEELAREALVLARAAAEELAPSINSSCLFCYRLARSLHAQVVEQMENAGSSEGIGVSIQTTLETAYELVLKAKELAQQEQGDNITTEGAVKRARLVQLEAKVLLCLAYLHLYSGKQDSASCLRCTEALRQLETEEAGHPAVALLAFKAFMALGIYEEAEKEATGIAVSDITSQESCLAVLKELLEVPGRTHQLKPVVRLILGRFPQDANIFTTFIEMALTAAQAAAAATTLTDAAEADVQHQACQELQTLVLEQLAAADQLRQTLLPTPEGASWQTRLRDALYQYGLGRFSAKQFDVAVTFFSAALEVCEDNVKGRIARVLAMCHLGQQQLEEAKSLCTLSETYEPGVIATAFIRFKVLLLQGDEQGVLQELIHMMQCGDYCNDMLWFAFKEANTAGATLVAVAALDQLHAKLQQHADQALDAAASTAEPACETDRSSEGKPVSSRREGSQTSEGLVLRVLVRLVLTELEKHTTTAATATSEDQAAKDCRTADATAGPMNSDKEEPVAEQTKEEAAKAAAAGCLAQLSEALSRVAIRVKKLGLEAFTGEKEASATQLLEWFGICAWNAGLHAARLCDYQGAAVLMNVSAQLLALMPSLGPKQLRQQRMAYTIAAAAGLEVHRLAPEHQGSLRLVTRMCQAATAIAAKLPVGGSMTAEADGSAEAYTLMLQFKAAYHSQLVEDMRSIIQKMIDHAYVGADVLHHLYHMCTQEQNRYPGIAASALEGSLQKLLSSNKPNYSQVAVVMRTLLQMAGSDTTKLKLYREAASILSALPTTTYPSTEAAWLVSTSWNRGLHHMKFDRKEAATAYMQVAIDMLPACPQHAPMKPAMLQQLQQLQDHAG